MNPIHVLAGLLALAAGATALIAAKGAAVHRRSGWAFVCFVWVMSSTGAALAVAKGDPLSVLAGALSFYLVTTGVLTVRRSSRRQRVIEWIAALLALFVATTGFKCGWAALHDPTGRWAGYPAAPYLMFGAAAGVGGLLDLRHLLSTPRSVLRTARPPWGLSKVAEPHLLESTAAGGKHRLARHLWRMGYAMFIATSSFFLGQAKFFPEPMRHVALLSIPVALVVASTAYWLARVLRTSTSEA